MSERDYFSKKNPKYYVTFVEFGRKKHGHILFGKHWIMCLQIYFNLVSEYRQNTGTRDVALSNSMAQPIKLTCCVFKQVFLVFPWRDILN